MVHREPCCWKWHSSSHQRSTSSFRAIRWSFFICALRFRVGLGNKRAWLAPPKAQLRKQPLALADAQMNTIGRIQMMAEQFAIPQALGITPLPRVTAQVLAHLLQRRRIECRRTPGRKKAAVTRLISKRW